MTSDLIFEPPPPDGRYVGANSTRDRLDELRQHPGEWARWPTKGSINRNIDKAAAQIEDLDGEFQITTRKIDGVGCSWIRFIPDREAR